MDIRECRMEDTAALSVLMKEFFSEEEHKGLLAPEAVDDHLERALKLRGKGVYPLLLWEQERIVGYMFGASLYSNEYDGFLFFLDEFMVVPEARCTGLGGRALSALEEWCRQRDFRGIMLETMKDNSRVRVFYGRSGFHASERITMHKFL